MTVKTSVAQPAPPSTPETTPAYVLRGLGIFELHRDEILGFYRGGGRWLVPSGAEAGKVYEVRTGTRPERDRCECRGFASHKHCSHLAAAKRAARLSAVCEGCGGRVWKRDMFEADGESLAAFEGDLFCHPCAIAYGVL